MWTIEDIEKSIMDRTGLSKEQLDSMDIGDIERHHGIEATDPAKKKSLYKIESSEMIEHRKRIVNKILNDM